MSPFDYVDLILHKKKQDGDLDFADYAPFIVNRSLSYHLDCVPFVSEINMYPGLDKDMQYQYYLNSIRSMKRKFQPWQKSNKVENIECVKTFFGYSDNKAKEALLILSDEQVAEIKIITDKGGMK